MATEMMKRQRCLFVLMALLTILGSAALAHAQPADIATLKAKALATGQVSVIVTLNLPGPGFRPEGHLPAAETAQQRQAIAATRQALLAGISGLNVQEYRNWESVPAVALKVDAAALDSLARHPLVGSIKEDSLSRPKQLDSPQLLSADRTIGADVTFSAGFGGMGQAVVILDTGIDANHPFYGGRVEWQACFSNAGGGGVNLCNAATTGPDAADVTVNPMADVNHCDTAGANLCAHGSHVAGIAAGRNYTGGPGYNGVAPDATIIAIQVFTRFNAAADCNPNPAPCVRTYDADQISALNYVNTTVRPNWPTASVNMSLGGGGPNMTACDGDGRKAAIDNLRTNGIATVIAAGNDGFTDGVSAPGCISTAVTVGSVTDADAISGFSNMGQLVDLLAVGSSVDSSIPDNVFANFDGTSMATPAVAGVFAVLKAFNPGFNVADIETQLEDTGVLVRDTRAPNPAGAGTGHVKPRIDLVAALGAYLSSDLSVTKECKPDGPIKVGQTGTCEIQVHNFGPDPALDVTIVDRLVSNGTFTIGSVTATGATCTTTSNTVTCTALSIAPFATVIIRVPVSATTPQDINDVVTVSSPTDDNISNNTASGTVRVVALAADLQVSKTCKPDDFAPAGGTASCTILMDNLGPDSAQNVVLIDAHVSSGSFSFGIITPAGFCSTSGGTVTCTLGTLTAGQRVTVTVPVTSNDQVDINDIATVTSSTPDPNTSNNRATGQVRFRASADVSITKNSAPNPVVAGTNVTYIIQVTNSGPSTATNVVMNDTLPAQVSDVSFTPTQGSCIGGIPGNPGLPLTCNLGSLGSSASATITVVAKVNPDTPAGTILVNNAVVSSDTSDPNNGNNNATTLTNVITRADLGISKTSDQAVYKPSSKITYAITVTNTGPSVAQAVVVTDNLPDIRQALYQSDTGGCQRNSATDPTQLRCALGNLQVNESRTFFVVLLVRGSKGNVVNTATVTSSTTDPSGGNNSSTRTVTVGK